MGLEWHAQSVGAGSVMREGKPIISNDELLAASASVAGVAGGVVTHISRSR